MSEYLEHISGAKKPFFTGNSLNDLLTESLSGMFTIMGIPIMSFLTEALSDKYGYHNKTTNFRSYFLTFDDGARLELMNHPDMQDPDKEIRRTGLIHIALSVGSKEKVEELTQILRNDGYKILSGPRTTGDGYYESCIIGPEGNQIEITI